MTNADRIAIHESGHGVAGIALDIPIIEVTVAGGRPLCRRGTYLAPQPEASMRLAVLMLAARQPSILSSAARRSPTTTPRGRVTC